MDHKGTIILETDRLILRRFTTHDAESMFYNWASDDEVTKYLAWPTHTNLYTSRVVIADWVSSYANNNFYNWAITLKNSKVVIGSIGFTEVNELINKCEVGYVIGKNYWNKGIMTEALKKIINFGLKEVRFNRIGAIHFVDNPASGQVMLKCGMKFEGCIRRFAVNGKGEIFDVNMYGILKSDVG